MDQDVQPAILLGFSNLNQAETCPTINGNLKMLMDYFSTNTLLTEENLFLTLFKARSKPKNFTNINT